MSRLPSRVVVRVDVDVDGEEVEVVVLSCRSRGAAAQHGCLLMVEPLRRLDVALACSLAGAFCLGSARGPMRRQVRDDDSARSRCKSPCGALDACVKL